MSTALITASKIKAIAGHNFARGRAYLDEGRVLSCADDGAMLEGVVHGERDYLVRVLAQGTALRSDCTCPIGHTFCKHAVALALFRLEQDAQPAVARERLDRDAWSRSDLPAFATRAELEAWADKHRVKHVLDQSAEQLCVELPAELVARYGLRYALGRLSLRDVGSREGASRYLGARGIDATVAGAAHAAVTRAAGSVERGLVEETARVAPADPVLAKLWHRLVEVRRPIRERAFPRARAEWQDGSLGFDDEQLALVWKELDRVFRAKGEAAGAFNTYGAFTVKAQLVLSEHAARASCNCTSAPAGGTVACTHVLALIDAALDRLEADPPHPDTRAIAIELMRPRWARALAELAAIEARGVKEPTRVEVWWIVDYELRTWTLTPLVRKPTKKGLSAGARTSAARLLDDHRAVLADVDRDIAEAVASWAPATRAAGSYPVRAFAELVGHPRVLADCAVDDGAEPRVQDGPGGLTHVEVRRAPLAFAAVAGTRGGDIRVEASIERERAPRELGELLPTFAPGEPVIVLDEPRARVTLVDISDDARRMFAVLARHGEVFPPEAHPALFERLAGLETRVVVDVPRELRGREHAADLTVVLRLRLIAGFTGLEATAFVRPGPSAPLFAPSAGPADVMLPTADGERGYVRRLLAEEPAHVRAALATLPLANAVEGPPWSFHLAELDDALALVAALQEPPPGIEAEWLDAKPTVVASPPTDRLKVVIERKRDWFGITGDLKIESGRVELALLLDAARRQQRFVRVDADRWVELSATLRDRLLAVADRAFVGKGRGASPGIELSPGAVPAIAALASAGAEVEAAPEWRLLADRLAASRALVPKPPTGLVATLRDYQLEGHAWLMRVAAWGAGAVLADDMGLGKTIQAIAVLLDRAKLGPTLVLAPTSVALNWAAELAKFAPSLKVHVYAEVADRAKLLAKLKKHDVVILSYGLLVRDAELLASVKLATLVIDEAQALKNPTTQRAKAARGLVADFRVALSGTPFENHLGELWSLFATVFPGLMGSWEQFRERFATPIEKGKDPAARAALARVLAPFLLRRTKQEVARELPARTEIELPVVLSAEEHAMYEDARLAAIAELGEKGKGLADQQRRFQVLAALTRLRMLACHPKLHDPRATIGSSKLRRLVELVEELREEGHRALVFSQFTSHLALVREELDRAGFVSLYLDGATPAPQRAKLVQRFQDGEGEVFLISLKAGGTGINLTAADYVIHLDPWWNPAVEDQATDRAHRIGQTKPVTVYRLVAKGTIEEQILRMHDDKRALVAGILEGTDVAARLTTKDLLGLLEGGVTMTDDGESVSVH